MRPRGPLIVVSQREDLPATLPRVVTADEFLAGTANITRERTTVINLCRSLKYLSKGYYVSLIAEARGQKVLPSIDVVEAITRPEALFRSLQEAGVETVELTQMRDRLRSLPSAIIPLEDLRDEGGKRAPPHPLIRQILNGSVTYRPPLQAEIEEIIMFLGSCRDRRFQRAAASIYRILGVPMLKVSFLREDDIWKVIQVIPLKIHRLTADHRDDLLDILRNPTRIRAPEVSVHDRKHKAIAVLYDDNDPHKASHADTLDRLERIAARRGILVRRISPSDLNRLGEYDALFIRTLAGLSTPAFQFALKAESLGMPVIDDTRSIIRCGNKVFLHELLSREGVPTPKTIVVTRQISYADIEAKLGVPFILKMPDGSFSTAVFKVRSAEEYDARSASMFARSPLLIAQSYMPSEFDWRVTVLDGKPLFTCKYHMAKGHWQIRSEDKNKKERFGRVEAIPRDLAPRDVVAIATRTAQLIGEGLYGVDIKELPKGPVVIEINDNPNLDIDYEDEADGDLIYEEILQFFSKRIDRSIRPVEEEKPKVSKTPPSEAELRKPIGKQPSLDRPTTYRAYEVCGIELEYCIVDKDLEAASLAEHVLSELSGYASSDADLGVVGFSNEIVDHVLEIKTSTPLKSLVQSEEFLVEGIRRAAKILEAKDGSRMLPTGMHPWFNPKNAKLWRRSNGKIYGTYERLFDVYTHGWSNVHSCHVNLPLGREHEAVAMMQAAACLIPYLPALSASSPVYDSKLQDAVDGRLDFIIEHQARIPESCGDIVPEWVSSLSDYRRRVIRPMYRALDQLPDSRPLRREYFNSRGAVFKFSRKSMELRVLDTQECVRMDMAIAAFARAALRGLSRRLISGKLVQPDHNVLVKDFRDVVVKGSRAVVQAPHLRTSTKNSGEPIPVKTVLQSLIELARPNFLTEEKGYLELVERIAEQGSLSERIRAALAPVKNDEDGFLIETRRVYEELAQCLVDNRPWSGRGSGARESLLD